MEVWSRAGWAKAQEDARAEVDSADVARVLAELRQ
jgi:MraZ protein